MKSKIFVAIIAGATLVSLCACDKIFPPKKEPVSQVKQKPAQEPVKEPVQAATVTPAVKGTIVAFINGYPITLESLNDEIKRINDENIRRAPENTQILIDTKEKKINYLKTTIVNRILLYQEALKRKIDQNPDVLKILDDNKQQTLVAQLLLDETNKINVPSAAIEAYYNDNKDAFREPEERRVREIFVADEAAAKDALIRILQGEDFGAVAGKVSKAESAAKGGDLGFIKYGERGDKYEEFDNVAFSPTLAVGVPSSIFKAQDGYYIVKVEAKKTGKQYGLSEMWDRIKNYLAGLEQEKVLNGLVDSLTKNSRVEIKDNLVQ